MILDIIKRNQKTEEQEEKGRSKKRHWKESGILSINPTGMRREDLNMRSGET